MESLKGFGMLGLFLVYLLFQVNSTYAEGIAELKQEEAETIKKIYSNKVVDDSDLVPTRLSFIESAIAGFKEYGVIKRFKSYYNSFKSHAKKAYLFIKKKLKISDSPSGDSKSAAISKFSEFLSLVKTELTTHEFKKIFPGTYWCGDGHTASNYEELGLFKHTDACCRQHDNCPLGIGSGKSLGSLMNNAGFTRYLLKNF
ncbi:hypothetical protein KQX54_000222 [Cotesia glomerata]|uniref:phospholipase A2 n=1 Tax=Cotesia glomerata TaxID=32391 RepID=A0AAV7ISC9_COTGL|nr:hypothetical protein KQX54_000222 [Cotesia glomerata]